MKETKEFYYSELEDEIIVNSIQAEFKKRQEERKPYELAWELNMNFYLGNQFTYISNSGEILDVERAFSWENREVYNHIAPIIESRLAKLSKIKPNIIAKPTSNLDKNLNSAKLSNIILNNCLETNNFSDIVSTATHWSEITGTAFYKITWDSDKGSLLGKINDNYISSGDVKISACSPFEIYPDSNETTDINDCLSIIYAKAQPVKLINEIYNVDINGDDIDTLELNNHAYFSNITGRANVTKIIHSVKQGYAYLIERYEKPSKDHPNGKLTIVCKDKLLFDGDLPYKISVDGSVSYPFVKQISNKQLSSFWGTSIIERCIPIQRAYNSLKNKKHEYISRLASGVLTIEDGSVDIENLEDEGLAPGKILIYRNGSTPPKFMSPGTIPAELEKEEDSLLNELNTLSCISDISTNSNIPSNINSGSAISLLIEQDEARLALTAEYIRNAIKSVGGIILKLFKQYASTPRINKLKDEFGVTESIYWTNADLEDVNICLETNNELNSDLYSQKDTLITLYEKGIFADKDGNVTATTKQKLVELMGIHSFTFEEELYDIHLSKAKNENLTNNIEEPLEIEDHNLHIQEHTKYILTHTNLTEDIKTDLINHINKHKEFLNK